MTDEQIKYMANRFLGWRLPENFHPDAGISFKPTFNDHMDPPMRHNPIGTNLFDADQAEAMVRHMVEEMPAQAAAVTDSSREAFAVQNIRAFAVYCSGKLPPHISEDLRIVAALAAQGIEAATAAETVKQGSVHESPVGEADAPKSEGSRRHAQ